MSSSEADVPVRRREALVDLLHGLAGR